jgi:hypothetical protein
MDCSHSYLHTATVNCIETLGWPKTSHIVWLWSWTEDWIILEDSHLPWFCDSPFLVAYFQARNVYLLSSARAKQLLLQLQHWQELELLQWPATKISEAWSNSYEKKKKLSFILLEFDTSTHVVCHGAWLDSRILDMFGRIFTPFSFILMWPTLALSNSLFFCWNSAH